MSVIPGMRVMSAQSSALQEMPSEATEAPINDTIVK